MNTAYVKRNGFTLAEVIIITAISSLILTGVYRIFSATVSVFTKNDTKISNFRIADIIIEQFRTDVKDSLIFDSNFNFNPDNSSGAVCCFKIIDKEFMTPKMVYYYFKDGKITRKLGTKVKVLNPNSTIKDFKVIVHSTMNRSRSGSKKVASYLEVIVSVDRDTLTPDEERTFSDKNNIVSLSSIMYPKFFPESQTVKEKFWGKAREVSGSTNI